MLFNDALKHEREDYECQYLSTKCPFNRKKFLEKVRMGTETEVISDEINAQKLTDFGKILRLNRLKRRQKHYQMELPYYPDHIK